jgi:hypothetical protein
LTTNKTSKGVHYLQDAKTVTIAISLQDAILSPTHTLRSGSDGYQLASTIQDLLLRAKLLDTSTQIGKWVDQLALLAQYSLTTGAHMANCLARFMKSLLEDSDLYG